VREAQTSESSQHLKVDVVSDDGVCDLSCVVFHAYRLAYWGSFSSVR